MPSQHQAQHRRKITKNKGIFLLLLGNIASIFLLSSTTRTLGTHSVFAAQPSLLQNVRKLYRLSRSRQICKAGPGPEEARPAQGVNSRVADFLRQAEAQVEERREEGLLEEAEKLACDVLERRRTAQGKEHTDALRVEVALAKVLREGGKTEEATGYLEHALEAASRQGAACTAAVEVVAQAKKVMAWLLDDEEQYAESAPLHAEVLRWQLSVLGEKHRETLLSKMNIGLGLAARSFFTEACMPLEEALLGNSQVLGSTHLHTLASATNLAYVYGQLERFRDAEALHKETLLPGLVAKFGAEHPRTQAARQSLSQVLEMQDQFEEAEGIRREILQREASTYGALHPSTVSAQFNLAKVLEARGLMDQARAEYQSVEIGITELYGKSHPFAVEARTSLERLHASTPNSIDS